MISYPKIQTAFLRDPETKYKTLLEGQWAEPEFEYLKDNTWVFTEKVDGTNIRVIWDEFGVRFAGKTDRATIPPFLMDKLVELFPQKKFETNYPDLALTLYGEGFGAKIQKGGGDYVPDGVDFILFDVLIGNNWQSRKSVEDFAQVLETKIVPIVGEEALLFGIDFVRQGYNSIVAQNSRMAEGLVMRPKIELRNRAGHRIITKIKYKDFRDE